MNPEALNLLGGLGAGVLSAGLLAGLAAHWLLDRLPQVSVPALPALKPGTKPRPDLIVLAGGLGIALGVIAFGDLSTGLLLAVLVVFGWYGGQKGPGWVKRNEVQKRVEKMNEVFPQALGMAVQALKTGQTVPQVLEYLSRESPPPLKEEWAQVCVEMDLGNSAEMALSRMADKFPEFTAFRQFFESYKISRQTGAQLTHLLEVTLEGLEEKNRLLRKREAMTAQARLSGILMGLLPFFLATVFFLMDPDLMKPLFTEKIGWAILLMAVILEGIGFIWIRQLLQLEF